MAFTIRLYDMGFRSFDKILAIGHYLYTKIGHARTFPPPSSRNEFRLFFEDMDFYRLNSNSLLPEWLVMPTSCSYKNYL